jgi:hypothetical protein
VQELVQCEEVNISKNGFGICEQFEKMGELLEVSGYPGRPWVGTNSNNAEPVLMPQI